MCGRFSLAMRARDVADTFGAVEVDLALANLEPRYNIAPSHTIALLLRESRGRGVRAARWGVPWKDSQGTFRTLINVRSESLERPGPVLRRLVAHRCAIPADGFYEWAKRGGRHEPWFFRRRDGRPFLMAGLWTQEGPERWATILTTRPCQLVAPIHDRMPVILRDEHVEFWIDPDRPLDDRNWSEPFPADALIAYPVGRWVNDPRHDGPECARPFTGSTLR